MWTKEKPTKEGYYWMRNARYTNNLDYILNIPAIIVSLCTMFGTINIVFMGDEVSASLEAITAEWWSEEILLPD